MHNALSTPIGLFDSGVGGLSVLKEIYRLLPNESLIYFGDTARIPYGNKSPDTIIRYSLEISRFLLKNNIKLLVIACNTASAHALTKLQESISVPIIGVIQPSAAKAAEFTQNQHIGIIGTKGTIQSKAYEKALLQILPHATLTSVACPLFVPIVEENFIHHPASRLIVRDYLKPFKNSQVDTLILGCTHYPLLKSVIHEELGEGVTLIDSAASCAGEVVQILKAKKIGSTNRNASHQFFVSDDSDNFMKQGKDLFGLDLGNVKKILLG